MYKRRLFFFLFVIAFCCILSNYSFSSENDSQIILSSNVSLSLASSPSYSVNAETEQNVNTKNDEPHLPKFEISPGFGYAFGGGSEGSSPSLPVVIVGTTFWFSDKFGFGADIVNGIGKDLYEEAIISPKEPVGDVYPREYLGEEGLRYFRVMMRYRHLFGQGMYFNFGAGLLLGGRFRSIVILHNPDGPVSLFPETKFNGFSAELLIGRRLAPHFGIKAGVIFDVNVESNFFSPVVHMVVDF